MGSGGGEEYFSGGFGFIGSPPWPFRKSGVAGGDCCEVSYATEPLLAESSKAYVVFEHSPHHDGLLRIIMEKRLAPEESGRSGLRSAAGEGHAPGQPLQVGDYGNDCGAILYDIESGGRSSSARRTSSTITTCSCSSSLSNDNGKVGESDLQAVQEVLQEGSAALESVSQLHDHDHQGAAAGVLSKEVESPSSRPKENSRVLLLQEPEEERGGISCTKKGFLGNTPPVPPPPPPSFSWVDLDFPESFVNQLQDIDDSWLNSLPPLNTTFRPNSSYSATTQPQLDHLLHAPDKIHNSGSPMPFHHAASNLRSQLHRPVVSTPPPPPKVEDVSPLRKRPKRLDLSEPKYVVLTGNYESVLKDGFKWRKYGQKSVKNNIYPRSYYKCSYEGCCVHKHVECVALNPCLILTTYRGRHTH